MGGGSGGGQSNTNTQVQQIPAFEQGFAQENQDIARSIASQPYPTYNAQLIAGFSPQQNTSFQQTQDAATSYQPALNASANLTSAASGQWNPQTAQQYMSPYAQSALAPQIQQLRIQQGLDQNKIDAQATQAGAFGDSRHGVEDSLNNFYAGQNLNNLEQQGLNTAYTTGQNAFQNDQSRLLQAGGQFGNIAAAQQGLGLAGANANFNAGSQQQQLQQQQLTEAYNNFLNQVNWPQQQLYIRESALSNAPYNNTIYQSLAPTNSSAANIGAFSALSGLLGGGQGGFFGGAKSP